MSVDIDNELEKVLHALALSNVSHTSESKRISATTTRTTHTFSQHWDQRNVKTILRFALGIQPSLGSDGADLIKRFGEISTKACEDYRAAYNRRHRYCLLSFVGVLIVWSALTLAVREGSTQTAKASAVAPWSLLSFVMLMAGTSFEWVNWTRLPGVRTKLADGELTVEDCQDVADRLPSLQRRQDAMRKIGVALIVAGMLVGLVIWMLTV